MNDRNTKVLFELTGVSKSFPGVKVLQDIHLNLDRGKTTVVMGPSGCGKTVLLKLLIMLLRPDEGHIYFDGEPIDTLSEGELIGMRRRCGFLFQAGALFDSMTVLQNVAYPLLLHTRNTRRQIAEIAREKLALVGLETLEERLPAELSGGQQKRVALARAIALSPEVILYDEPTTGLDPIRADTINELIIKLQKKLQITSIVVTHDMNSAYKIADRMVMLSKGVIVADGSPDQIRRDPHETVQRFIHGRSDGLNGQNHDQVAQT
jgi:phospholipid/cholesterol/gamma-HCH transport system ATP-binding protein